MQGHIFVGVPPLYKLEAGKKSLYLHDEEELQEAIKGRAPGSYTLQRFKVRIGRLHQRSFAFLMKMKAFLSHTF
jgi:DNA gyrase/topoisomerase IV subunit B